MNSGVIIAGVITTIGTIVGIYLTVRGSKQTSAEDTLAKLIEVATSTQSHHVDQLQEDVDRYRTMVIEAEERLSALREKLREIHHAKANAVAAEKAAIVIINKLEEENQALKEHIESLERTIARLRRSKSA